MRINPRAPIKPEEDFSYRPGIQAAARPLSPVDTRTTSASDIINSFYGAAGQAVAYTKETQAAQRIEGQQAFLRGEEVPVDGLFETRAEGYYSMQGQVVANGGYKTDLDTLLQSSDAMTPTEFTQSLADLENKYVSAGDSEYYKNSFKENALNLRNQAMGIYELRQAQLFKEDSINLVNANAANLMKTQLSTALWMQGMNPNNLTSEDYTRLDLDTLDLSGAMRETLTYLQTEGKKMGLSKTEIAEIYVNQAGQLAIETGMPELLDFATIADDIGVPLDKTQLEAKIDSFRTQASNVRAGIGEQLDKAEEARIDQVVDTYYNNTVQSMVDVAIIRDPLQRQKAASELLAAIRNNEAYGYLSSTQVKDINRTMQSLIEDTYAESDFDTLADFKLRASQGALTTEEILEAKTQGLLSSDDALKFIKDTMEFSESRQKAVQSLQGQATQGLRKTTLDFLANPSAWDIDGAQNIDYAAATFILSDLEAAFYAKYGEDFTYDQYKKEVIEPTLNEYGVSYDEIPRSRKKISKTQTALDTYIANPKSIDTTVDLVAEWGPTFDREFEEVPLITDVTGPFESPETTLTTMDALFASGFQVDDVVEAMSVGTSDTTMMAQELTRYGFERLRFEVQSDPTNAMLARDRVAEELRVYGYPENIIQMILNTGYDIDPDAYFTSYTPKEE